MGKKMWEGAINADSRGGIEKAGLCNKAGLNRMIKISEIEFEGVPQYMRGRLSLDRINAAVDLFNRVIDEKYTLLRMNPAKMSVEMRQRHFVSY